MLGHAEATHPFMTGALRTAVYAYGDSGDAEPIADLGCAAMPPAPGGSETLGTPSRSPTWGVQGVRSSASCPRPTGAARRWGTPRPRPAPDLRGALRAPCGGCLVLPDDGL